MIELRPEQTLALVYGAARLRPSFAALLKFDEVLRKSVTLAREPILGQLRLGWWREQIEALADGPTGPDPLLGALGQLMRNHDVKQCDLVDLVNAWETMLDVEADTDDALIERARARGGAVFRLASAISGSTGDAHAERAGTLWALVDFARHGTDRDVARRGLVLASEYSDAPRAIGRPMRPFAILAHFARCDSRCDPDRLPRPGSPRRIFQAWQFLLGQT